MTNLGPKTLKVVIHYWHYFQHLLLIHCDIPSHFYLEEWLFWCKHAPQHGLLPSCTTFTNWLFSQLSLPYHRTICCSAYIICLQNFHMTHISPVNKGFLSEQILIKLTFSQLIDMVKRSILAKVPTATPRAFPPAPFLVRMYCTPDNCLYFNFYGH